MKKYFFYLIVISGILCIADLAILIGAKAWKHLYRNSFDDNKYFTIYVIGESTSVGEPFQTILSYPKIISRCFDDSIMGKPIRIVNLAQGGTTLSYSYWELQHELLLRPRNGCLLIYSGINENIDNSPDHSAFIGNLFHHSFLISKMLYLLGASNSLAKYKQTLRQTIELAQSYNLDVVVSELVGNFAAFDPDVTAEEEAVLRGPVTGSLLSLAYRDEQDSSWNGALADYIAIDHSLKQHIPYINYKIGKCLLNTGKRAEAVPYFNLAVDTGISTRPATWKNDAIREVSNCTHAYLIEPLPVFNQLSPKGVTDYHLFMDAHHPSEQGYQILANEFSKALSAVYHIEDFKNDCTSAQILQSFHIQNADECRFCLKSCIWHICLASNTYEPYERISSANNFLEKAKRMDSANPDIIVYDAILALYEKNIARFKYSMSIDSVWANSKMVAQNMNGLWNGKPREIPLNTLNSWLSEGVITCREFNAYLLKLNLGYPEKKCMN